MESHHRVRIVIISDTISKEASRWKTAHDFYGASEDALWTVSQAWQLHSNRKN